MDKYVLNPNFHIIDMDCVDIILAYPWMDIIVIVNTNVENKFMKLLYKKGVRRSTTLGC